MSFDTHFTSFSTNFRASIVTNDLLWNIILPGDPYDIRK